MSELLDDEARKVADAWVEELSKQKSDPGHWAIQTVIGWKSQPELVWNFIMYVVRQEVNWQVTGNLAAGPLEDLLSSNGPQYIDRVELLARRDPKFNYLLGGVWQQGMTNDVWERVQRARLKIW